MKRFGKLLYDEDIEHWRFEDRHGAWWLHSGDTVAFHLGERYVQGRIETLKTGTSYSGMHGSAYGTKEPMLSAWRNSRKNCGVCLNLDRLLSAIFARTHPEFQTTLTLGKEPTNNASSNIAIPDRTTTT